VNWPCQTSDVRARPRGRAVRARSDGVAMLEALVGAVVFALAALAIVGFQARAAQALHHAHFRGEAQQLAHSVLARMQAADNATLYTDFDMRAGGTGYRAFAAQAQRLPGVDDTHLPPELLVTAGPSSTSRVAAVAVQWRLPGDIAAHRYATTAVVGGR